MAGLCLRRNIAPHGAGGGEGRERGSSGVLGEEDAVGCCMHCVGAAGRLLSWEAQPGPPALGVRGAFHGLVSRGRDSTKANTLLLAGILTLLPGDTAMPPLPPRQSLACSDRSIP